MTPARWLLSAAKGTPRIFARTHRERTRAGNRSQGLSTYTAVHGCPSRPGAAARESATRYSVKSSDRRADGESREPQLATSKECVDRVRLSRRHRFLVLTLQIGGLLRCPSQSWSCAEPASSPGRRALISNRRSEPLRYERRDEALETRKLHWARRGGQPREGRSQRGG